MTTEAKIDRIASVCKAIVTELVDHPNEVVITPTIGNAGTTAVMTVRANRKDFGKVIGRQGKNVEALRVLLEAIAAKNRMRMLLEIDDGHDGRRRSNDGNR